jgi:hypothetical protein
MTAPHWLYEVLDPDFDELGGELAPAQLTSPTPEPYGNPRTRHSLQRESLRRTTAVAVDVDTTVFKPRRTIKPKREVPATRPAALVTPMVAPGRPGRQYYQDYDLRAEWEARWLRERAQAEAKEAARRAAWPTETLCWNIDGQAFVFPKPSFGIPLGTGRWFFVRNCDVALMTGRGWIEKARLEDVVCFGSG